MTRPTLAAGLAASLALALAMPAGAQSLRIKQAQRDYDARYAEAVASANLACGTAIEASIDWPSFPAEDFSANVSISGYCEAPVEAIRDLCVWGEDGLAKAAIAEKVTRLTCERGSERTLSLAEDLLRYVVSFESSNDMDFARDWLLDNL